MLNCAKLGKWFALIIYLYYLFLVSNEVPDEPVVSPVSGSIFEKRLIVKFIKENNSDPVNGNELTVEQLVNIKSKSN